MSRAAKILLSAFAPLVLVALLVAGWSMDTGLSGGEVVRNVELAGEDIGGLAEDALGERVEDIAAALSGRTVRISTPEITYEPTAEEIGLSVNVDATVADALDVGREGPLVTRPLRWMASFVDPLATELTFSVDRQKVRATLRELQGETRLSPTEPTIVSPDGGPFVAVPGAPGTGIDPGVLADALLVAATRAQAAPVVEVMIRPGELPPRLDDSVAEAAATRANELTDQPLQIAAGEATAVAPVEAQRTWLRVAPTEDDFEITVDPEPVLNWLAEAFAGLQSNPEDARITLENGQPVIIPSRTGTRCCQLDAAVPIEAAMRSGNGAVQLELVTLFPEFSTEDAEALGIVTEVGQPNAFGPTTRHACCGNRVQNIHRIADTVRGVVIRPGETFSINDFVGRRTREKGYLPAGAIANGETTDEVGGGISQFATTLFNAALYAGLEFGEYQSHSLYFSRYPRGHEATVSWPAPDLQIVNTSPYGVLIWPTYTNTSITVHLYSSPYAEVTLSDPVPSPAGNCTRWTTTRTRRFVTDGTTDTDTVFAVYRPAEGVDC